MNSDERINGSLIMAALPLILAGPIVRQVEAQRCSFWVALSKQTQVTAHLWVGIQSIQGTAAGQATPGGALASGTALLAASAPSCILP
jgi:hypothetical protein